LFVFALFVCAFAQSSNLDNLDFSSCGLCTLLVSNLENYASSKVTKEDLLSYLTTASNTICDKIPSSILSKEKCVSYVQLYGPYTVDLILSKSDVSSVCKQLQLCTSNLNDEINYNIVYPVITDDQVVYSIAPQEVHSKGEKFYYRFFLGNPSFLMEESLTTRMYSSSDCNFQFEVVNKERNFDELVQCPAGTGMHCTSYLDNPGRGVWYYVTVTAGDFTNETATAYFNLTSIIENEISSNFEFEGVEERPHFIPIFIPIVLIALCVSCCCAIRRKRRVSKPVPQELALEQIQVENPEMPVGYYYAPQGYPMYVPMQMQGTPQPIYVIAQPE
jgi:hypothetical protein